MDGLVELAETEILHAVVVPLELLNQLVFRVWLELLNQLVFRMRLDQLVLLI